MFHLVRPTAVPAEPPTTERKNPMNYVVPVPKNTERSRSVSTESIASSETESSAYSDPALQLAGRTNVGVSVYN